MKREVSWLVWPAWFGLGVIDRRANWYTCYAFGPLLLEVYSGGTA